MSGIPVDGKDVVDVTRSQLGRDLFNFAVTTVEEFHRIVTASPIIRSHANSLTGFMLNHTMIFMQFIEQLILAYKASSAQAYHLTKEDHRNV